jgi:hypothetical protein
MSSWTWGRMCGDRSWPSGPSASVLTRQRAERSVNSSTTQQLRSASLTVDSRVVQDPKAAGWCRRCRMVHLQRMPRGGNA